MHAPRMVLSCFRAVKWSAREPPAVRALQVPSSFAPSRVLRSYSRNETLGVCVCVCVLVGSLGQVSSRCHPGYLDFGPHAHNPDSELGALGGGILLRSVQQLRQVRFFKVVQPRVL